VSVALLELRELGPQDEPDLVALFERCDDFFALCYGLSPGPEEAERALAELPPGSRARDKTLYGIYLTGEIMGVAEAVRGFPDPDTVLMGLLMLSPEARSRGLGSDVLASFVARWEREGFQRVRAGVSDANERARSFLQAHGFDPVAHHIRKHGDTERGVTVMIRELHPEDVQPETQSQA